MDVIECLKDLKDGTQVQCAASTDILGTLQQLVNLIQDQSGPKLEELQSQIRLCVRGLSDSKAMAGTSREDGFLRWLYFRQKDWRYEEVDPAYQATFEWIFRKPDQDYDQDPHWDDLLTYLTEDSASSVYFINGKAGSGKSTLMKFIARHPKLINAVESWAGKDEHMILNFFFWNVGSPLQKSQVGLLRSLLYNVLRQYPELIPAVFPILWAGWNTDDDDQEPAYIEVKSAFELLVQKSAGFLKLCILIDGIDEYEGDHRDLSRFLRSLSSTSVKLVVSSRPINPCLNVFQGSPSLRLQDLTRNDMRTFIQGELSSHPLMVQRLSSKTVARYAKDMVDSIDKKAEGVFLWVRLVIKMLIDGLEAGDDVDDLQRKLNGVPSDLKELYRSMFRQRPPEYRLQADEMFRIFSEWFNITNGSVFSAINFSFALRPYDEVFHSPVRLLDYEVYDMAVQNVAARIRSRCCGLLEVRRKDVRPKVDRSGRFYGPMSFLESPRVVYLHKTVAEFITSDEVWSEICESTTKSGFQPIFNIASATLSMMKSVKHFRDEALHKYMSILVKSCRVSSMSENLLKRYIEDADRTMNIHWAKLDTEETHTKFGHASIYHWSRKPNNIALRDPCVADHLGEINSLNTFAARHGLLQYLKSVPYTQLSQAERCTLVVHAQESWRDNVRAVDAEMSLVFSDYSRPWVGMCIPSLEDRSATLAHLLAHAAKPETLVESRTLWSYAVFLINDLLELKTASVDFIDLAELLRVYLRAAKDPWELIHDPFLRSPHQQINVAAMVDTIVGRLIRSGIEAELVAELRGLISSRTLPLRISRKRRRSKKTGKIKRMRV